MILQSLRHNLPLLLNDIPDIVKEKLSLHSSQGVANYENFTLNI